jgi:hypothetical protein
MGPSETRRSASDDFRESLPNEKADQTSNTYLSECSDLPLTAMKIARRPVTAVSEADLQQYFSVSEIPYADHHSGPTERSAGRRNQQRDHRKGRNRAKGPFERFGTCRRGDQRNWNQQCAFVRLVVFLN